MRVNYSPLEVSSGNVTAARSEVIGDPGHPGAVIGQSRLGMRQQRRAYRPGLGQTGIAGNRVLDQRRGGWLPFSGQPSWHLI
jgi:hypothetical protein